MKRLIDRAYARQRLISWERSARRAHSIRLGILYFCILAGVVFFLCFIGK